jgi:hypothetical protein
MKRGFTLVIPREEDYMWPVDRVFPCPLTHKRSVVVSTSTKSNNPYTTVYYRFLDEEK